ncbi:MAG: DUF2017 domain-containing protein [Actinomycetota bacterium]|nr:DUF2017 domain-containing protein [Actinomycetota bacterium]
MFRRRPIRALSRGRYRIDLAPAERQLLEILAPQLTQLLSEPSDDGLQRLFPPAYHEPADAERQVEYRRLMQEDLVERHRHSLDLLVRTAQATELSSEELETWLRSINALRLVLGTRLDVSEEDTPDDDLDIDHQIYYLLGYLQECAIDALTAGGTK